MIEFKLLADFKKDKTNYYTVSFVFYFLFFLELIFNFGKNELLHTISLFMMCGSVCFFVIAVKKQSDSQVKKMMNWLEGKEIEFIKKYINSEEVDENSKSVAKEYLNNNFKGWSFENE